MLSGLKEKSGNNTHVYLRYKDVRPNYVGITKDVDIRAVQLGDLVTWWLGGLVAWWLGGLVAWWLGEMFDKIVRITEELLNCGHAWIREPEIIHNNSHF
ncbi:hypothetical protein [Enterobacter sp. ABFQC]|uniref:hypothetical protein n=1 Tax=Enterobacter sp. ABFQC TaxID=1778656 RepID=UPI00136D8049|nr:hypothetical protein [Enterobacter sp. ABFQC]